MDENVVKHLIFEEYDVLMFYDYVKLETDFDFEVLNTYQEKNFVNATDKELDIDSKEEKES